MPFTRANLVYTYSWEHTKSDDPKLTGEPDSSMLNRSEGYEVLYIINKLMEIWDLKNVATGQKIEEMIKDHPSHLRSQLHVKEWINENWGRY